MKRGAGRHPPQRSLFMFDVDRGQPARDIRTDTAEGFPWEVVFARVTSSGPGLRLVCKARVEVGNIADNQIALAKELDVKPDLKARIDASRISYAPVREDLYYLNEAELINYPNESLTRWLARLSSRLVRTYEGKRKRK